MYVFGYGSLMSSSSAATTIQGLDSSGCIPAHLEGHTRTFDVAFPNDGSQPDKAYVGPDGSRPGVVLFANLRRAAAPTATNGVLLPVEEGDLDRLAARERRYEVVDVTDQVRPYETWPEPEEPVVAFVGRAEFTALDAVAAGVLDTGYLATIASGVAEWAARCAPFARDFGTSTQLPAAARLVPLQRVAAGPAHGPGGRP